MTDHEVFPPHTSTRKNSYRFVSVDCVHEGPLSAVVHVYSLVLSHAHRGLLRTEISRMLWKQSYRGSVISSLQLQKGLATLRLIGVVSPATGAPAVLQPPPRKLHVPMYPLLSGTGCATGVQDTTESQIGRVGTFKLAVSS